MCVVIVIIIIINFWAVNLYILVWVLTSVSFTLVYEILYHYR